MVNQGRLHISIEDISPGDAARYLAKNGNNRSIKRTAVARYARAMSSGEWDLNGEPIRFSDDGELLDGQNRLTAVIQSGRTIQFLVIRGLNRESRNTIDLGVRRTPGDTLKMQGFSHANSLASACRLLWCYLKDDKFVISGENSTPSPTELSELMNEHSGISESMEFVSSHEVISGIRPLMPPSDAAFLHYIFSSTDRNLANDFIRRLSSGDDLPSDSPILFLRNRLIADRLSKARIVRRERLAICIKAWNKFKAGTTLKQLRWRSSGDRQESFPKAV